MRLRIHDLSEQNVIALFAFRLSAIFGSGMELAVRSCTRIHGQRADFVVFQTFRQALGHAQRQKRIWVRAFSGLPLASVIHAVAVWR